RSVLLDRADGPFDLLLGRPAEARARSPALDQDAGVASGGRPGIRADAPRVRGTRDPATADRGRLVGLLELAREASSQTRPITVNSTLRLRGKEGRGCGYGCQRSQ